MKYDGMFCVLGGVYALCVGRKHNRENESKRIRFKWLKLCK